MPVSSTVTLAAIAFGRCVPLYAPYGVGLQLSAPVLPELKK